MTELTIQDQGQLREAVRQRYAAAATRVTEEHTWAESALPVLDTNSCCSSDAACSCNSTADDKSEITSDLYAVDEVADLPSAAVLASLGCGNPTALAELRPCETVLDLGSSGGIDVLLSAKRVGPTGFASCGRWCSCPRWRACAYCRPARRKPTRLTYRDRRSE
jgi:hypothetical protein